MLKNRIKEFLGFKGKQSDVPKLEFTERQTSPYSEDNVTIIHTGSIVHGTMTRTKYNTYKVELCGHKAEYMNPVAAEVGINHKWRQWYE